MRKLIQGIVDFRKSLTEERRALFSKLALGQKPDALFIACSDSRVVPHQFASTNPGDLFVLRNIGNFIPPATEPQEVSAQAAIEFAIFSLKVSDIVVCGHSECGAIQALIEGIEHCPHLTSWLKHGRASKERKDLVFSSEMSQKDQISQANVLQQIDHLVSYPFIRERMEENKLHIHGWWFDIARADVYCYEPSQKKFVLIDEKEAKLILERL